MINTGENAGENARYAALAGGPRNAALADGSNDALDGGEAKEAGGAAPSAPNYPHDGIPVALVIDPLGRQRAILALRVANFLDLGARYIGAVAGLAVLAFTGETQAMLANGTATDTVMLTNTNNKAFYAAMTVNAANLFELSQLFMRKVITTFHDGIVIAGINGYSDCSQNLLGTLRIVTEISFMPLVYAGAFFADQSPKLSALVVTGAASLQVSNSLITAAISYRGGHSKPA